MKKGDKQNFKVPDQKLKYISNHNKLKRKYRACQTGQKHKESERKDDKNEHSGGTWVRGAKSGLFEESSKMC